MDPGKNTEDGNLEATIMNPSRKGSLFVVGGAEDRNGHKLILRRFIEESGGTSARIVVIATASSEAEKSLRIYEAAFADLGVKELHLSWQRHRIDAEDESLIEATNNATGIFFTGGDQLKLATTLGGTGFTRAMHARYREGTHIGGTSAGASALCTVMIARGHGKRAPRLSSVRLSPGLGILRRVIVDQHFQERDRFGRLIAAVIRNPYMLGFGIDEKTAFIVDPKGDVEVIGKGTLTIVDGSNLQDSNVAAVGENQPLAFAGITLHVLAPGWGFNINTRELQLPEDHRAQDVCGDSSQSEGASGAGP